MRAIVGLGFAGLLLGGSSGCYKDVVVPPTGDDVAYMQSVVTHIPQDLFYIPADLRFGKLLGGEDSELYRPTESFSKKGDSFRFPVYSVIRDACEMAVANSFSSNLSRANSIVRHDEFVVDMEVALCEVRHSGGSGRAFANLRVLGEVRLPSGEIVHSFEAEGQSGEGQLTDNGTGVGPGVLWLAAGDLATRIARELQGVRVRDRYPQAATLQWRSTENGRPPPPDGPVPPRDITGVWGTYIPVVRLPGGAP